MAEPRSTAWPGRNPFEPVPDVRGASVLGREGELAAVLGAVEDGRPVLVLGPPGHGKSMLVDVVAARVRAAGRPVVAVDAGVEDGVEGVAEALLAGLVRELTPDASSAVALLRAHFPALRPEVSVSAGGLVTTTVGSGSRLRGAALLGAVLEGLTRATEAVAGSGAAWAPVEGPAGGPSPSVPVVVVDGLEHLLGCSPEGAAVLAAHAAESAASGAGWVLAARPARALRQALEGTGGLGEADIVAVGPVNAAVFGRYIEAGFRAEGLSLEAGAPGRIMAVAEAVPRTVQRLAAACWEEARAEGGRLTSSLVDVAARAEATRAEPFYASEWRRLTTLQRRTVRALVGESGLDLFASETSRRYGVPTPTIQSSLRRLEEAGLVWVESGRARWRLSDPLFGVWLERGA